MDSSRKKRVIFVRLLTDARQAEPGTLLTVIVVDDAGRRKQVSVALKPDGDRELVDFILSKPCAKEGNLDIEKVVSLEMQWLLVYMLCCGT